MDDSAPPCLTDSDHSNSGSDTGDGGSDNENNTASSTSDYGGSKSGNLSDPVEDLEEMAAGEPQKSAEVGVTYNKRHTTYQIFDQSNIVKYS